MAQTKVEADHHPKLVVMTSSPWRPFDDHVTSLAFDAKPLNVLHLSVICICCQSHIDCIVERPVPRRNKPRD